ncbi:MAG: hypothetical protein JWO30_815 [Fibrobacteres bacterium]|nr:hypothetical protein [Fibrobacterota bacterium]
MEWKKFFLACAVGLSGFAPSARALDISKVPASDWIDLFNGKDLTNWVPKVHGTAAGQDPLQTWYVKDGLLWVDYKGYGSQFNGRFGHMAWQKRKFSYYVVHAEADNWGAQSGGAPDWAFQNNGLMLHSQSMESMDVNQDFPTSVECQLLGSMNKQNSDGKTENGTTANVCGNSSNTSMIINGTRQSPGCFTAKHVKIDSSHFQVVEALVLGDSLVKHMVAADTGKPLDTVLTYSMLQTRNDSKPLKEGYITIQGESAPWKFRKIRVLDLVGCTDSKSPSYRSYFVKSDPSLCTGTTSVNHEAPRGFSFQASAGEVRVFIPDSSPYSIRITDLFGRIVASAEVSRSGTSIPIPDFHSGLCVMDIRHGNLHYRIPLAVLGAQMDSRPQ